MKNELAMLSIWSCELKVMAKIMVGNQIAI
jgi:hypothetical protein